MTVMSQPSRAQEGGCDFPGHAEAFVQSNTQTGVGAGTRPAARPGVGGVHLADWPTAGEDGN